MLKTFMQIFIFVSFSLLFGGYIYVHPHFNAIDNIFITFIYLSVIALFFSNILFASPMKRLNLVENREFYNWVIDTTNELDTEPPITEYLVGNSPKKRQKFLRTAIFRQRVLNTLLQKAPFGILIFDSEGQPFYVNRAFRELLGYSWREIRGMSPIERAELMKPVALTDNLFETLEDKHVARYPFRFRTRNGQTILVNVQSTRIQSESGFDGTIMFLEELTDYEKFVRLQTQAVQILEVAVQGISIFSPKGTATYVNDSFARITRISKEQWARMRFSQLDPRFQKGFAQSVEQKTSLRGVTIEISVGQEERSISYDFLPILTEENGHPISILVWCRDITDEIEWRYIHQQADLFQSLTQMAASMAHEVRNPMAAVIGFLQLLRESRPYDSKVLNYSSVMMAEIQRVNEIITEYLNMSKTAPTNWEVFDLDVTVREIGRLMEVETNSHSIRLKLETKEVQILGEERRIKQVLLNLAKNAVDATSGHGDEIFIRVYSEEEWACVEVQDTGIGISKDVLDQVFLPYFTTKSQGTGLGLAVCKDIVDQHRGKINVKSEPDVGTSFTVCFPKVKQ